MIVYPVERGGFDKVFARIHIMNTSIDVSTNYMVNLITIG
jgi:hypothetical protein